MGVSGGDSRTRIMPDGDLGTRGHSMRIEGDGLGSRDDSEGECGNQGTYRQLFHHENIVAPQQVLRISFYQQHSPDYQYHAEGF